MKRRTTWAVVGELAWSNGGTEDIKVVVCAEEMRRFAISGAGNKGTNLCSPQVTTKVCVVSVCAVNCQGKANTC